MQPDKIGLRMVAFPRPTRSLDFVPPHQGVSKRIIEVPDEWSAKCAIMVIVAHLDSHRRAHVSINLVLVFLLCIAFKQGHVLLEI